MRCKEVSLQKILDQTPWNAWDKNGRIEGKLTLEKPVRGVSCAKWFVKKHCTNCPYVSELRVTGDVLIFI